MKMLNLSIEIERARNPLIPYRKCENAPSLPFGANQNTLFIPRVIATLTCSPLISTPRC